MDDTARALREAIIATCREMNAKGLNQGTSGNLSHRVDGGVLITPSSVPYETMEPEDIVELGFDGTYRGRHRPSSEWRFHRDILKARPDVDVVLHNHATYSTALACHERGIPPFHYMTAIAGGHDIRVSTYACFGTQELSDAVLKALEGRSACLVGHHGLITVAKTLAKALPRARRPAAPPTAPGAPPTSTWGWPSCGAAPTRPWPRWPTAGSAPGTAASTGWPASGRRARPAATRWSPAPSPTSARRTA